MLFVAPPAATDHARRSRPTIPYDGRKHSRKRRAHLWTVQTAGNAHYTVKNKRQSRSPSNAHHTIADKHNKQQQTSNMRRGGAHPTNKQPHGHTATRAQTHATHKARRAQTSAHAQPQQTTPRARVQGNPATAPNRHSHGASRHRLRPSTTTHGNHTIPKQGDRAFPTRTQQHRQRPDRR